MSGGHRVVCVAGKEARLAALEADRLREMRATPNELEPGSSG